MMKIFKKPSEPLARSGGNEFVLIKALKDYWMFIFSKGVDSGEKANNKKFPIEQASRLEALKRTRVKEVLMWHQ